jgi:hypothetical protein
MARLFFSSSEVCSCCCFCTVCVDCILKHTLSVSQSTQKRCLLRALGAVASSPLQPGPTFLLASTDRKVLALNPACTCYNAVGRGRLGEYLEVAVTARATFAEARPRSLLPIYLRRLKGRSSKRKAKPNLKHQPAERSETPRLTFWQLSRQSRRNSKAKKDAWPRTRTRDSVP